MTEVVGPYIPPKKQAEILPVSSKMVEEYWTWFVNRRAYLVQRHNPDEGGKHGYYAPKDKKTKEKLPLTLKDVRLHLAGLKTISLYAIEPEHSTCKWIAIDADYTKGLEDLERLRNDLKEDGIEAVVEKSRRGGHLWIFGAEPLPAALCRLMVYNLALGLGVAIKGHDHEVEGIEIFPRQDRIEKDGFGNALRGPLGVHRKTVTRYWFDGIDLKLKAQFDFLRSVRRLTLTELQAYTDGMTMPEPEPEPPLPTYTPIPGYRRPAFDITKHVNLKPRPGRNSWGQCPSCARIGKDRGRDNLAVNKKDTRLYKCWAGCTKDDIRVACGYPPARRF
jgi:hypothetical protein